LPSHHFVQSPLKPPFNGPAPPTRTVVDLSAILPAHCRVIRCESQHFPLIPSASPKPSSLQFPPPTLTLIADPILPPKCSIPPSKFPFLGKISFKPIPITHFSIYAPLSARSVFARSMPCARKISKAIHALSASVSRRNRRR
jgi:hypothetical protein